MAFVGTLLVIVAVAVALLVAASANARRRTRGAYRDADGQVLVPASGTDAEICAALEAAGADLSTPHEVRCFLQVPTQSGARRVAGLLRSHGFTDVRWESRGSGWAVQATMSMAPHAQAMRTLRADLDGLARSVGGTCDGWTAAPIR